MSHLSTPATKPPRSEGVTRGCSDHERREQRREDTNPWGGRIYENPENPVTSIVGRPPAGHRLGSRARPPHPRPPTAAPSRHARLVQRLRAPSPRSPHQRSPEEEHIINSKTRKSIRWGGSPVPNEKHNPQAGREGAPSCCTQPRRKENTHRCTHPPHLHPLPRDSPAHPPCTTRYPHGPRTREREQAGRLLRCQVLGHWPPSQASARPRVQGRDGNRRRRDWKKQACSDLRSHHPRCQRPRRVSG